MTKKLYILFFFLSGLLLFLMLLNISLGSIKIPFNEVINCLMGNEASKTSWEYIILNFRLPKAFTAVLVGIALSISGLLMQTLFRNPLAGPYVLGLSSGASLGVAIVLLGAGIVPTALSQIFTSSYGLVFASGIGSALVLFAVLFVSQRLKDTMSILIVGLMFGSLTSAIVSVLSYFTTAEQLQKYTFWQMGSLGNLSWHNVTFLTIITIIGLGLSFLVIKPLDALLLGERYANSLGINFKRTRYIILIATSLLAGSITAFVGPIAFIGLAVPHMAKLIFQTSNHFILFWSTALIGSITLLLCDIVAQLPGSDVTLPINAITSIIGAPVVIWLLVRKRKIG